ncbi:DEKNAAC104721 [Brettanomyces naardenensis]|uniref:DEKNAAC104721 n=1 Tax=Brettanomyces naardenensis TaxID=13370 RepID=A0A448YRJ6_BRENA|nr:DEKNAAC104721 [Brettanomyces naardenensis]
MPLTEEQIRQFDEEGCVVLKNYLDSKTVKELNHEIDVLYSEIDLSTHPMTKFTTEANGEHVGDDYFFNSSNRIHFFFEPDSFDSDGKLIKPVEKAINKIGHGLHFLNEKFRNVTVNEDISQICRQLGYKDARALQSMVISKQPEIGGEVPPHADSEFLYTDPISCMGFWFALQDCTVDNGCLGYIPGSHKKYTVKKRLVRDLKKGQGTKFVRISDPDKVWEPSQEEDDEEKMFKDPTLYKLAEIPAGSLVLIHGKVIHKSERNTSKKSRNAYTFHIVDGAAKYDSLNWLQVPPDRPSGSENSTKL